MGPVTILAKVWEGLLVDGSGLGFDGVGVRYGVVFRESIGCSLGRGRGSSGHAPNPGRGLW